MKKAIWMPFIVITVSGISILSCANNSKTRSIDTAQKKEGVTPQEIKVAPSQPPLNIAASFIPCGWMGDGQMGKQYISFDANNKQNSHSRPSCIKISYKIGPEGYAGIYWMNKETNRICNWGDSIGYNLSSRGYTKITFWAKGANGGESVQFKAGGVSTPGKRFRDSFDCEPKLVLALENQWKKYTIDLRGKDLSNVIGGFCWVADSSVTFYLDDMQYE